MTKGDKSITRFLHNHIDIIDFKIYVSCSKTVK